MFYLRQVDKMKTYFTTPPQSSTKATLKIVILYFVISLLWIFFSDTLLGKLNFSLTVQTTVSIIKGWGFVIVTSILLYFLIKRSTDYIFNEYNMINKIMETVPVGITFVSKEGQIAFTNKNAEKILGLKKEQITTRTYKDPEWKITSLDGSPFPVEQLPFYIVKRTGDAVNNVEHAIEYISGRRTLLSINAAPIKDKNNNFDGMISVIDDITERKKAEEEILKLNRVYAVISQINQAIVHLREKDKLLCEACRVAIEFGKFHMAWIGLVDDETRLVNPVAFAGNDDGYLSKMKKISVSDLAEGRGPTGTAIREGKHFVCNDIENDPRMAPWKSEALNRGYRSSIALPIKLFGEVTGAFSLYASVPHFFDQKEIDLLDEVAGDLSFALEAIEVGEKREKTEHTLIDSEKRYRELFMNHPHPMWIYEVDTLKIIEVNEAAINNYGYTKDEFTSLTLKDIRPKEDVPLLLNNVKIHDESIQRSRTFRHKKKDGTIIHVEISSHSLPSLKNTNYRIVMAIDITEQFKAEEDLHESEERFRTAFEHSASGMCLTALDGNFLQVNKALCKMLGYAADELLKLTFEKITYPDDIFLSKSFVDKAMDERAEVLHFEKRYLRKNGEVIWAEVSSSLLRDAKKKPRYFITQIIDVTERKRAEEMLNRNEEVLRLFVEHSPASIAMFDTEMKYIVASHRYLLDYDLGDQNLVGRSHYDIFPEIPERWVEIHKRCLSGATEKCDEDLFPRASGKVDWVRWEIRPWYELNNKIGGIILFSEVITETKNAEATIRESEERLRLSTELANVAVWEFDLNANSMSRSKNHDKLYGLEWQSNWEFETFLKATHPDDREYSNNIIRKSTAAGGPDNYKFDFRVVYPDKSIHWLEVTGEVIERNSEGLGLIVRGTLIDITERKHAENELLISNEKFTTAFQVGPAGLTITRISDGKFIDVNDSFLNMFGFNREEVIGHTSLELNMFSSEQRKKLIQAQIETGGVQNYELLFRTKFGKPLNMLFSSKSMVLNGEQCLLTTLIDITDRIMAEDKVIKSREELRLLSAHLQNVREDERKNLAREMHDEVGQILTSIKMNLSLMRRQLENNEKKVHAIELEEEIQSMAKMVDHAVVRVRKMITELRPELLDKLGLIPALEWHVDEFEKQTKIRSEFKCDFEELPLDHNVELTIFRIIQEALTNVVKHASAKFVSIKVQKMKDHILVEVIDDGKGITEEELKGKESFGLLGMRERANLVGGKIDISGIVGKGTTVRLVISDF